MAHTLSTDRSGPNQPLNQHPLPNINPLLTLGMDSYVVPVPGVTGATLLQEAPPKGVSRAAARPSGQVTLVSINTDLSSADFNFFMQDTQGRRYYFDPLIMSGVIGNSDRQAVQPSRPLYFNPEMGFTGFYIDIAVTLGNPEILCRFTTEDVRGVQHAQLALSNSAQTLVPAPPPGLVSCIGSQEQLFPSNSIYIANFDDVDHNVVFSVEDADGNSMSFGDPALAQAAPLPNQRTFMDTVSSVTNGGFIGGKMTASLLEPLNNAGPVYVFMTYYLMNKADVRTDQGGAYFR